MSVKAIEAIMNEAHARNGHLRNANLPIGELNKADQEIGVPCEERALP